MSLIYLSDRIEELSLDLPGSTLCVVHPKYQRPQCIGASFVEFSEFASRPREMVRGLDHLVMVGVNRMINPGNRTEMVWEVIHNNTPDLHKIVVDSVPFLSDPWRIWFLFGAVSKRYLQYTYSYIAESHYNAFWDDARDEDPFSLSTIIEQGSGVIESTYRKWFTDVHVSEVVTGDSVHAEYAALKARCFDEETSPKAIIKRLSSFAQESNPLRSMVSKSRLWNSRTVAITKTDLGVDDYLCSEIMRMVGLTNGILEAFHGQPS